MPLLANYVSIRGSRPLLEKSVLFSLSADKADFGVKMRESEIERRLVSAVKAARGLCLKWSSPSMRGVPDRICLLPGGRVVFVEVKSPTGKLSALQRVRIEQLAALGHDVRVINSEEQADAIA